MKKWTNQIAYRMNMFKKNEKMKDPMKKGLSSWPFQSQKVQGR